MSNPLVSVIVPTYNCAPFVEAAIGSVLSQGYAPMEVVVVDDGSTDGTPQVLERFGDRIRVFTQANSGPARTRNRAIREARGEYLAFLDGDDLWLPGHTEALMSWVRREPAAKVVFGDWLVWPVQSDGSYAPLALPAADVNPGVNDSASGWLYPRMLFDSMLHIIATVLHRSVHAEVGGFDETLRTGSDYDFWLKVSRRYAITKLRSTVAVYRHNPSSVTYSVRPENNPYRLLKRAVDTYGLADDQGNSADPARVQRRLAELAFAHGYKHYWRGDPRIAQQSFLQALSHHRWNAKTSAYVLASMFKRVTGLPAASR